MTKNMMEPERPQAVWRMRVACCISKATRTRAHVRTPAPKIRLSMNLASTVRCPRFFCPFYASHMHATFAAHPLPFSYPDNMKYIIARSVKPSTQQLCPIIKFNSSILVHVFSRPCSLTHRGIAFWKTVDHSS